MSGPRSDSPARLLEELEIGAAAASEAGETSPLAAHFGQDGEGRILFAIAIAFSVFQIATAAHLLALPSLIVRAFHVGFLMLLALPLVAAGRSRRHRLAAWGLGLLGFAVGLYQWFFYQDLLERSGDPTGPDMAVGIAGLAVLFVAAWRAIGPALPIISGLFLAYGLFGQYLPPPLDHRPYDFSQIIDQMSYGTEGIYGIPTYVSSSYIFLFIVFVFVVFLFVILVQISFFVKVVFVLLFVHVVIVLVVQADTFNCGAESFAVGIFGVVDRAVEGVGEGQTQGEEGSIAVDGLRVGRHEDVSCSEYVLGIDAAGKKR